jgi:hypothetical protein
MTDEKKIAQKRFTLLQVAERIYQIDGIGACIPAMESAQ